MDTSFTSLIDNASSILILLPTKPYFDQVAAGLSLYLSLVGTKEVGISCPSPMMVGFNRIIGINKIVSEIGNKNLTIKFNNYDANNIEKVSYDIDNGQFKLTVVPKAGFASPQKDQLDLSFTGISSDLVILIGGANDSHFPILTSQELVNAKIVHIGTRVLESSREVMSLAKPASSTSELIANLIKENNLSLDVDSASNLIMGIEEGSSHFESSETTPETFETFAYLLRSGGRRQPKERLSPMNFPIGSIPSQPFFEKVVEPEGTNETEVDINPPSDWLQTPKVFKGSSVPQSDSFSENKG
ncbi:MAG TPA: hypothetical protein VL401_00400 [Alphaproteobacteria bacterium]|jgi:hypothetical protein|nr:hypothetical protein [Alphaproteobacteria bacterium]